MENPFNRYKVNAIDSLMGIVYVVASIFQYQFVVGTIAPALPNGGIDVNAVLYSFPTVSLFGFSYSPPDLTSSVVLGDASVAIAFVTNARFNDDRYVRANEGVEGELLKRFRAARSKWSPAETFGAILSFALVLVPYYVHEIEVLIRGSVALQVFLILLGILGFTAVAYDTE